MNIFSSASTSRRQWLTLLAGLTLTAGSLGAPQLAAADDAAVQHTQVKVVTNLGDMIIELYPDKAPVTVENFLKYVDDGYYEGTIFHRVIEGFMIQGGGFTLGFDKKQTRDPIQNEADNQLKNDRFTVAMARTQAPHSASAQFFINVEDNEFLNHRSKDIAGWGYTVFGKVIEGQDIADWIGKTPTGPAGPFGKDVPTNPIVIEKIEKLSTADAKAE